jgi:hypothetical protein
MSASVLLMFANGLGMSSGSQELAGFVDLVCNHFVPWTFCQRMNGAIGHTRCCVTLLLQT